MQNVDVYLIQQTWLEGTIKHYKQIEIDGYTCFLHGNKESTCSRGKGGNKPDLGDGFDCARFICLTLKFSNK
jgi:hypothetical protein